MNFGSRNSSALPSVTDMGPDQQIGKDIRKKSVLLPNGNSIIDSVKGGGSSLALGGSNVVGGIDNYKRYQMLVKQQTGATTSIHDKSYKRS